MTAVPQEADTPAIEFVHESAVTLYRATASDLDVARAAWVSQDADAHEKEREEGRVEGLINFLWRNRHTSPFEHGQFTFVVETPIFVAREFMRHRTFSYNEISGRYTVLPHRYYLPPADRPLVQSGKVGSYTFGPGSAEQVGLVERTVREATLAAHAAYTSMLEAGVAREVARDVLPVSTMTTFWATTNPRNLMHFLGLRSAPDALHEIRQVAGAMERVFAETMPLTHRAWRASAE